MNHLHLQEMLLSRKYQHTLTDLLVELRDDPEAIEMFVEFHPGIWDDLAETGYAALELCQYPQASAIFGFLLEYHYDEPAYHAAYADACCGVRAYLDAGLHYNEAVTQAPDIPDGYYYLAEVYMMFRHPEHAIDVLEDMAERTDEDHHLAADIPMRMAFAQEAIADQAGVSMEGAPS